MTALLDHLQLFRSPKVGPLTYQRLMAEFDGDAAAALDALPGLAGKDYEPAPRHLAEAELEAGQAFGAELILRSDPRFSPLLAEIDGGPPLLWAKGDLSLLHRSTIAIVGARNASSAGLRISRQIAREIGADGFIIVSGLARGIDGAVHDAALASGTIAVVAGGLDVIYPPEHEWLHAEIGTHGLILSEMPMGMRPLARHFPRRNRIISGLAQATVLVEAALKSGSMITARDAAEQGREVMAIPGSPLDPRSLGCNALIRDGATLVQSSREILETLGHKRGMVLPEAAEQGALPLDAEPAPPDLPAAILSALSAVPETEDHIIRALKRPAQEVMGAISELEILGQVTRLPGGRVCLA
ncbi:DNA-processing protein DprA [Paracoccaceae bacterium GXU_MW_L88]